VDIERATIWSQETQASVQKMGSGCEETYFFLIKR